jgi:hypothetical protein
MVQIPLIHIQETRNKEERRSCYRWQVCQKKSMSSQHAGRKRLEVSKMKHRWPTKLHSQVEAVFHSVRSIREAKTATSHGVRSFGTWKTYKYEAHRLANFMQEMGVTDLLDTVSVQNCMKQYMENRLAHYVQMKRSRQTMETTLSALGKFEYAFNQYLNLHFPEHNRLETENTRMALYAKSKKQLCKSSKIFDNRAYPDPIALIETMGDGTHQMQASLQYEGGLRTEGVGAPSNRRLKNPLMLDGMHGISTDPVTGKEIGIVSSKEKGGKVTEHYISTQTYQRLLKHIMKHGALESDYNSYVGAINQAAHATGQYSAGRGSHGLKHNFAQERYLECITHGMSHEQALQQTSLETSHFRLRETLTYTRG